MTRHKSNLYHYSTIIFIFLISFQQLNTMLHRILTAILHWLQIAADLFLVWNCCNCYRSFSEPRQPVLLAVRCPVFWNSEVTRFCDCEVGKVGGFGERHYQLLLLTTCSLLLFWLYKNLDVCVCLKQIFFYFSFMFLSFPSFSNVWIQT